MRFAILARLSNESHRRKHLKDRGMDDETAKAAPETGQDINNRDEQVNRCTQRIESMGGTVVHIYDEPHTSAWKRRKVTLEDGTVAWRVVRPIYKLALGDLSKGKVTESGQPIDGLMIADVDRLTRDNRDLEDAIDTVIHSKRPILDRRGALDLLTETGRTYARVIVAFKAGQSADTALRGKDKHVALQREGIPTGGHRPFGWNEDKRTLHPEESKILRKAVADLLEGKAVTAIVADWNRRGILTARGKTWTRFTLKTVLRNPRMAGYRMVTVDGDGGDDTQTRARYTVTARDEEGNPVIGKWDRMISPEEWERVIAIIGAKPGRGDGANVRNYLGTGTLRCGKNECDAPLRALKATAKSGKPEGFFWYTCQPAASGGCGGVKIDGPATDTALIELALAKYELEAEQAKVVSGPTVWDRETELEAVREDIAAARAARRERKISAERYYADLHEYEAQERKLVNARNAFLKATVPVAPAPATLREDWEKGRLTLVEQRIYLERAFSAVVVAPVGRRRNVPVQERLTPVAA